MWSAGGISGCVCRRTLFSQGYLENSACGARCLAVRLSLALAARPGGVASY